jgi:hypothetical protein
MESKERGLTEAQQGKVNAEALTLKQRLAEANHRAKEIQVLTNAIAELNSAVQNRVGVEGELKILSFLFAEIELQAQYAAYTVGNCDWGSDYKAEEWHERAMESLSSEELALAGALKTSGWTASQGK